MKEMMGNKGAEVATGVSRLRPFTPNDHLCILIMSTFQKKQACEIMKFLHFCGQWTVACN